MHCRGALINDKKSESHEVQFFYHLKCVCVWWQKGAKWVGTWSLQVLSKVSRNVQPSKKGPDHGRGENVSTKSINRHYVVAFFYLSVKFDLNGSNSIRFYSVFFFSAPCFTVVSE